MLQPDDEDRWPMWDDKKLDPSESRPQEERSSQQTSITGEKRHNDASRESLAGSMRYMSLGTELFGAVVVGTLLGWAVSWLVSLITGHEPIWIIAIGVILGAVAGFFNMYHFVVEEEQREEQKRRGSSR
ncbi:MAG TPA: AtpZ/AtpI family protein [Candidatus Aquicultor sp.]|jgi:F0F1-type ATP synthase assembly protein I